MHILSRYRFVINVHRHSDDRKTTAAGKHLEGAGRSRTWRSERLETSGLIGSGRNSDTQLSQLQFKTLKSIKDWFIQLS
jgi:hypothetical protein